MAMGYLVLGLVLFLGVHSVRIVADGWRTQTLARMGEMPWKGLYSLVSAVGLALPSGAMAWRGSSLWCCGCRPSACGTRQRC